MGGWRNWQTFAEGLLSSSRISSLTRVVCCCFADFIDNKLCETEQRKEPEMTLPMLMTKHWDKLKPVWRHPRRVSIVSQRKHQQNHCRNWNTKTLIFRRKCENENEDSNVFKTHSSVSRFRLERFFAFSSPTKAATFKNTLKTDSLMNKINHSDFWI